jgi:hypothetical protein
MRKAASLQSAMPSTSYRKRDLYVIRRHYSQHSLLNPRPRQIHHRPTNIDLVNPSPLLPWLIPVNETDRVAQRDGKVGKVTGEAPGVGKEGGRKLGEFCEVALRFCRFEELVFVF